MLILDVIGNQSIPFGTYKTLFNLSHGFLAFGVASVCMFSGFNFKVKYFGWCCYLLFIRTLTILAKDLGYDEPRYIAIFLAILLLIGFVFVAIKKQKERNYFRY